MLKCYKMLQKQFIIIHTYTSFSCIPRYRPHTITHKQELAVNEHNDAACRLKFTLFSSFNLDVKWVYYGSWQIFITTGKIEEFRNHVFYVIMCVNESSVSPVVGRKVRFNMYWTFQQHINEKLFTFTCLEHKKTECCFFIFSFDSGTVKYQRADVSAGLIKKHVHAFIFGQLSYFKGISTLQFYLKKKFPPKAVDYR